MLDLETEVEVSVGSITKKWYESLGYEARHVGDLIKVKLRDLTKSSTVIVHPTCDYCGEVTSVSYDNYNRRLEHSEIKKYACQNCAGKKNSEVRLLHEKSKTLEKLNAACEKYGYALLTDENEYTGQHGNCTIICPKHGRKVMSITSLLSGHKCIDCSYEERGQLLRNSKDRIASEINSVNGNELLNPDEYINATTNNLLIKCGCCNTNTFRVSYVNYNAGVNRCRICSSAESRGEMAVRMCLEDMGINYVQEKRFEDCKDARSLPFDFYLTDYNAIIKYDGDGHFADVFGEESYKQTIKHDDIKNSYCRDMGIPLLRIPYWNKDKIYDLINNFITALQI